MEASKIDGVLLRIIGIIAGVQGGCLRQGLYDSFKTKTTCFEGLGPPFKPQNVVQALITELHG